MGLRRKGRELAFKVLYSLEYAEKDELLGSLKQLEQYPEKLEEVLEEFGSNKDKRVGEFAEEIIKNSLINHEEIDERIIEHSRNWSIDRLAVTDRTLLRMGIYEIMYTETPNAIVMDEIIEIAKRYCSESSGKFVNGVLNAVANQERLEK